MVLFFNVDNFIIWSIVLIDGTRLGVSMWGQKVGYKPHKERQTDMGQGELLYPCHLSTRTGSHSNELATWAGVIPLLTMERQQQSTQARIALTWHSKCTDMVLELWLYFFWVFWWHVLLFILQYIISWMGNCLGIIYNPLWKNQSKKGIFLYIIKANVVASSHITLSGKSTIHLP